MVIFVRVVLVSGEQCLFFNDLRLNVQLFIHPVFLTSIDLKLSFFPELGRYPVMGVNSLFPEVGDK